MRIGDLEYDEQLHELRRSGVRLPVQKKGLELLVYLARQAGRVVPSDELQRGVWGSTRVTEGSLRQAMLQLRRALGDDASDVIVNVRGIGYRLGVAVSPDTGSTPPPRGGRRGGFVGRESELSSIEGILGAARTSRAGVAFVSGEPGIGKTRLAEEVAGVAREQGFRVAVARGTDEPGIPEFWPWIQLFRALGFAPPAGEEARGDSSSELGAMFPGSQGGRGLTPAQAQFRLFDGVRAGLQKLTLAAPLALIFDDLHWADRSSLRLLRFVAQSLRDARLFVLGTYRDTAADLGGVAAEIVGGISCLEGVRTYPLEGLTSDDVARWLSEVAPAHRRPGDAARLRDWTSGNPLFLVHVLPLIEDAAASGAAALPLARGVRAAVRYLVSRARPEVRDLLTTAAVAGVEFNVVTLSSASRVDPSAVLALLDEGIAAGLVEQGSADMFRFVHALVRDALYGELEPSERAVRHETLALALEAMAAPPAELAHHFGLSGPHRAALSGRYARLAGQLALERLAYDEAACHFETSLERQSHQSGPDEAVLEILLDLGSAQSALGLVGAARSTFRRAAALARASGSGRRLAEVALRLAPGLFGVQTGVHDVYLEELLREALEVLGKRDNETNEAMALRARLMGRLAMALYFSPLPADREELGEQAVALARRSGDRSALAFTLMTRHGSAWTPDNLDVRLAVAQEALALARSEEDLDTACVARCFLFVDRLERGDVLHLDHEIQELWRAGERHGVARMYALAYRGARALMEGRFDDVERLAFEYLALGERIDDHNARQACGVHIALSRNEQGRGAELAEPVRAYVRQYGMVPAWRMLSAFLSVCVGDLDEARADLELCARDDFGAIPRDFLWLGGLSYCALAASALGEERSSAVLYELMRPYADRYAAVGHGVATMGSVEYYLGILAAALSRAGPGEWHERARAHLARGIERNRAAGIRTFAAWSEAELGRLLTRDGASDEDAALGRESIASARRTASALGMTRLLRELDTAALQHGSRGSPS